MKELFIHIGLSKTGSSAIQSWLSLNHEKLKKQGISYLDLSPAAKEGRITAGNGVLLFHACNDLDEKKIEELITNYYFSNSDKAIISSEALQQISIDSIQIINKIASKNNIKINIIAYARSVYELLYSNYLQGIKRHGFTFKFGEREFLGYKKQRNYLENYHEVFKDNLIVLNYDYFKRDIVTSFLGCLKINNIGYIPLPFKKVNRSLTTVEADILRKMNQLHKGAFSAELSDYLIGLTPNKKTGVLYNDNLLKIVTKNSTDDLHWINEKLIPKGGNIQNSLGKPNFEICLNKKESERESEILELIVDWCLSYETTNKKVELTEFVRDLAVDLETYDLETSFRLMGLAKTLRPKGQFIIAKYNEYKSKLDIKQALEKAEYNFLNLPMNNNLIYVFAYDIGHANFILSYLIFIHKFSPHSQIELILTSPNLPSTQSKEFTEILEKEFSGLVKCKKLHGDNLNFIESLFERPYISFFFKFLVSNNCIINQFFYNKVPCISIQANSHLSVEPYYDFLFVQSKNVIGGCEKKECVYPIVYEIPKDKKNLEDEYILDKKKFSLNIISAARANRIGQILKNKKHVRDMVISVTSTVPNLKWTFVGVSDMSEILAIDSELMKLYELGKIEFTDELGFLSEYMAQFDIYAILPECSGGGMIAKMAVHHTLPCVGLNGIGDSLRSVTDQYISKDIEDYSKFLIKLCLSPDLRKVVSENQYGFQSKMGSAEESSKFSNAIHSTLKDYYS